PGRAPDEHLPARPAGEDPRDADAGRSRPAAPARCRERDGRPRRPPEPGADSIVSSDKTEQPTAKRKREARRDGNLARSPEVVAWAQMLAAGVLLPASFSLGRDSLREVMNQVGIAIARPDADASFRLLGSALRGGLLALAPLALGMVAIGLAGNFAQTGLAFSGKALKPKFDRISPKKGLKRLLSPHSAWEPAKAALKLVVLTAVAWPGVAHLGAALATGGQVPAGQVLSEVASSTMGLLRTVAVAGLALA